jgi:hypothetical protein
LAISALLLGVPPKVGGQCSVDASLVRYDLAGEPTVWTAAQNPDMVNSEADAKESDANGNVRLATGRCTR